MHGSSNHNDDPKRASAQQRRFGVLLAVLAALAAWFAQANRVPFAGALLMLLAIALGALAVWRPRLLRRPLQAWLAFGALLARIVSPIILALMYYVMIAPIAIIGRWTGRDELRLKRDAAAPTYWIEREAPGPTAESFRQQF
jgi:amino acid permease